MLLPDVSIAELALIDALAAVSAVVGGVAGYGTGALMPLILVPLLGAAPVVPIIAISAMFTNTARVTAFRHLLDRRRAVIALVAALPTCVLGAWGYTLLTGKGAALVIGEGMDMLKDDGAHQGKSICAARRSLLCPPTPDGDRGREQRFAVFG